MAEESTSRRDALEHRLGQVVERLDVLAPALQELQATVEAALAAQATRIETLLAATRGELAETARVQAESAEGAAASVTAELARSRDLTADRLGQAGAELASTLEAMQARVVAAISASDDAVDRVQASVASSVAPIEALAAEVDALHAIVTEVRDDSRDHRVTVREISERVGDVATAQHQALDHAAGGLRDTGDRVEEAVARLAALQDVLVEYLSDRDRRVAVERAALTQSFVEQLAGSLTRRERRRLARRVEVPETDRHDVDARIAEVLARSTGTLAPIPDRPPPVDEPAEISSRLSEVRGLGAVRQSVLIDRFGTTAALREASDDEILAIDGIGPALLSGIRDAVA